MKVLIVGAGIAGPAAAIALHKAGISSVIYEAYPEDADDTGAFVTIAANGQDALLAIDADQPVLEASFSGGRLRIFDSAGTQVADLALGRDHPGPRTITRAALSRVLREEAVRCGVRIEYGKRLADAATSGTGVRAFFADGSHADADLLIGADGIHSPVRTLIDSHAPAPRYTGLIVACGYADHPPVTTPEAGSYDMIHGSCAFFGHTTGTDGRDWWFARIPSPELAAADLDAPAAQWRDRLADAFAGDNTPAAELIRVTSGAITITSAYDIPALPAWHNDTMIAIGDAAHATSPSTAQGTSMALEDAVILAQCLRDVPCTAKALTLFEQLRRERVERVVQAGASTGNPSPPASGPRKGGPPTWLYGHHIDWDATVRTIGDMLTAPAVPDQQN
jgi:2-polyprenyl-6-methoxyphenol hydroxylase-like FAD-dependent oxidoreductase